MQTIFFKLIREDWKHFDREYSLGEHRYDGPLDPDSDKDGLYFCHINDIPRWTHLHENLKWVCSVRLFRDSTVLEQPHKFKTDHFELYDPVPIQDFLEAHFSAMTLVRLKLENIKYFSEKMVVEDVNAYLREDKHGLHVTRAGAASKHHAFEIMRQQYRERVYKYVVQRDGTLLHIKTAPFFIQEIAIKQNPFSIRYIEHPRPDICLLALQRNGLLLRSIKSRSPDMYKTAIKQNGLALQYLTEDEKTNELETLAVQQNGYAIQYVRKQRPLLCLDAYQQNKHVKDLIDPAIFEILETSVVFRNGKMLRRFGLVDEVVGSRPAKN